MSKPLAALRYRDYAIYAAARFFATLCWTMLDVAVGWQVYAITRNPLDLGLVGLAQFVPFVVLVLPAGQIADRADRRIVLLGAYFVSTAAVVVLPDPVGAVHVHGGHRPGHRPRQARL